MAFRISASSKASRSNKLSKCISAFEDDDDDDEVFGHSEVPQHDKPAGAAAAAAGSPQPPEACRSTSSKGELDQGSACNWVDKGSAFAEQGDTAAALRCWDHALQLRPENGRIHEMRAQVLDAAGRTYEALQAAQQAVRLCPTWADAHVTLARVQLNFGEPQLALHSYQAAARLQPDHPDVVSELPTAQMYAKLHAQQQPGSRAHVRNQLGQAAASSDNSDS